MLGPSGIWFYVQTKYLWEENKIFCKLAQARMYNYFNVNFKNLKFHVYYCSTSSCLHRIIQLNILE